MSIRPDNAAYALQGRTLKNGWEVTKLLELKTGDTGGFFSVCYIVNNGGQEAFLKAINFRAFFQLFPGRSIIEILQEQTAAFQFERDLLRRCKKSRLSKVSLILDEGEEIISEYTIPNVPYLIFELADGNIRSHLNFSKDVEIAWKLRSLHDVAVGLQQLHGINIGHQDLKPSNVLLFQKGIVSKLGDLGRSLCTEMVAPHSNGGAFPGDFGYAPPEFLYGYIEPNLSIRMRATDMFLLGSLLAFYFTGTNMTALIGKNIDPIFNWNVWKGSFDEVKDYLKEGFYRALKEFRGCISSTDLASELSTAIEYCCFPDPNKRGYPTARTLYGNPYDLQMIISKLDVLSKKAEYQFK